MQGWMVNQIFELEQLTMVNQTKKWLTKDLVNFVNYE